MGEKHLKTQHNVDEEHNVDERKINFNFNQ